ncbi:hypothetical protein BKA70DRAFT_1236246 [Coprinopsis sp. MPI-PUGE-AT-0042]|nr:hypothetical protein BKA70DRAFT_1236246 [Coprinopsis sp. MPI-PUGE-AT-0042]
MSSDKSDHEAEHTGHANYTIHEHSWRHPEATACFRILDKIYRCGKFSEYAAKSGSPPHLRTLKQFGIAKPSQRPPVNGLAWGLYSESFLASLLPYALEQLNLPEGKDEYDFSHTPDILQATSTGSCRKKEAETSDETRRHALTLTTGVRNGSLLSLRALASLPYRETDSSLSLLSVTHPILAAAAMNWQLPRHLPPFIHDTALDVLLAIAKLVESIAVALLE